MKNDISAHQSAELTPEQFQLARKMEGLMDEMEKKVFGAAFKLNGTQDIQTKNFNYEAADYVVKVTRGAVVEKCGFMRTSYSDPVPER